MDLISKRSLGTWQKQGQGLLGAKALLQEWRSGCGDRERRGGHPGEDAESLDGPEDQNSPPDTDEFPF